MEKLSPNATPMLPHAYGEMLLSTLPQPIHTRFVHMRIHTQTGREVIVHNGITRSLSQAVGAMA